MVGERKAAAELVHDLSGPSGASRAGAASVAAGAHDYQNDGLNNEEALLQALAEKVWPPATAYADLPGLTPEALAAMQAL